MYVLIGFVCLFVGVCIGWHFGKNSGFKDGFASGKESERDSLISIILPAKCPYCNKEYGIKYSPKYNCIDRRHNAGNLAMIKAEDLEK